MAAHNDTSLPFDAKTINEHQTTSTNPFVLFQTQNFKSVEASRASFRHEAPIATTHTPSPVWKYGLGTNATTHDQLSHLGLDPSAQPMIRNYRLLIFAIPRPISLVSTINADGKSRDLAPFSCFQVVDHDPPIFVIGFSARATRPKDARRNLLETGECFISVVSEHMIEGVNATSLDVPFGAAVSEWEISGFGPAPSSTVKTETVMEAVFSVEGKLLEM